MSPLSNMKPTKDLDQRLNMAAGLASVALAVTLVSLKFWALHATGALSVAASLADSALDLLASLAALIGIRYAAKPPDKDHSFGHTSVEDLVALGQAIIVTVSAAAIGWSALRRLGAPEPLRSETAGLAVMAASVALTAALVFWQSYVTRRTKSKIVAADRLHYLSDLWPNLGAMVALYAAREHQMLWLDPAIALLACVVLLLGARRIGADAWDALMDRSAPPAQLARIETVLRGSGELLGFHDLRTRTAGTRLFVQVHIELDGDLPLRDAHAISARLKRDIIAAIPQADVIIHQDPV
jgi:ferrous-iron efflux pump FieF